MHKKILILIAIIIAIFFGRFIVDAIRFSPVFFQLVFNRTIDLKKADHTVNVLLLGIGGGVHEGPNLTDTVIFASIDPSKKKVSLVSIPRDLWIPDIDGKINAAYAFGQEKDRKGLVLAKAVVAKIVGQPIDYGVRIDFNGFMKAVDQIGGLDVDVERSFDDYEYPISGKEQDACDHTDEEIVFLSTSSAQLEAFPCRYKHIRFDKGKQHMSGEQALEFVRSRHAQGDEGSDVARSKRQEKIILAFKERVFSLETIFNPTKILNVYAAIEQSIDMDIKQEEFDDFIRLARQMQKAKIETFVLEYNNNQASETALLINPATVSDYNNQWVLIPRAGNGDYTEIQSLVRCRVKGECLQSKKQSH